MHFPPFEQVTAWMKEALCQELSKSRATEIPKPHALNKGALRSRTALDQCHSTTAFLKALKDVDYEEFSNISTSYPRLGWIALHWRKAAEFQTLLL